MDTSVDVSGVAECEGKPCVAINLDESALSGNEVDIGDVIFSKKDEVALDTSTDKLTYEVRFRCVIPWIRKSWVAV